MGLEHVAIDTNNFEGEVNKIKAAGIKILEELVSVTSRSATFASSVTASLVVGMILSSAKPAREGFTDVRACSGVLLTLVDRLLTDSGPTTINGAVYWVRFEDFNLADDLESVFHREKTNIVIPRDVYLVGAMLTKNKPFALAEDLHRRLLR
jgi:hypothetical protein